MRYINNQANRTRRYDVLAREQLITLKSLNPINRKGYLNDSANKYWNNLKRAFENMGNQKCWFTEAYASISDFYIEHFRPKNTVHLIKSKHPYPEARTATDTLGYWWLSYEYDNLRLAGSKPNQKKGNYFPLISGSRIALNENINFKYEKPLLLDPCVSEDPDLLVFDGTTAKPSETDKTHLHYSRAEVSIIIYDLNSSRLKKARSRIYEALKNNYDQAKINFEALLTNNALGIEGRNLAKDNFMKNCLNIITMLKPNRQFTSMVESFLRLQNENWIDKYIIEEAKAKKYIK